MNSEKEKLMSKADIILLVVIAVTCVIACMFLIFGRDKGKQITIYVDGRVIHTMELDKDGEYMVETEKGTNLVIVENGEAFVREADCPDRVCVKHKSISETGETIICLPHKLVVEISQ